MRPPQPNLHQMNDFTGPLVPYSRCTFLKINKFIRVWCSPIPTFICILHSFFNNTFSLLIVFQNCYLPYHSLWAGSLSSDKVGGTFLWRLFAHSTPDCKNSSSPLSDPEMLNRHSMVYVDYVSYRKSCEWHLNIRINQVPCLSTKSMFEIWHDRGVHPRQSVSPVYSHKKFCPLSGCCHTDWDE